MKESNKYMLTEAIKRLPLYEPKENLWEAIDLELTRARKEAPLLESVKELPTYTPPTSIWDNIDTQLNEDQAKRPKTKVFRLKRWAAIAAVFIAVSSVVFMLNNNLANENGEYVAISYSEEKVAASLLNVDWEEDEEAFKMVAQFCKIEHIVCKQPAFKVMTEELEELNAAKEELKQAMDSYGNDPDLIAQLTAIEHERSSLLKKIIKVI